MKVGVHVGQRHAHEATGHASLRPQLRQDRAGLVNRHRKPDVAGALADRGVDAHHLAAGVDQRSAAVAEIDGRVGLNVIVEAAVEELAAEIADHADGDRVLVGQRVADGAYPFAHAQRVGIAERSDRKIRALNLDQSDIRVGIAAHDVRQ